MRRLFRRTSKKLGLPPGTLVHIGDRSEIKTNIDLIEFDSNEFSFKNIIDLEECEKIKTNGKVNWLNIDNLNDVKIIEKIGSIFNIHPLVLEDIVNTTQRTKIEEFENYFFIVLKKIIINNPPATPEESTSQSAANEIDLSRKKFSSRYKYYLSTEQLSFILLPNLIISFQEKSDNDVFTPIRDRIKSDKGKVRKETADYLLYTLMDCLVDNYLLTLEKIDEETTKLEDKLLRSSEPEMLIDIKNIKKDLITFRKTIWPLREVINHIQKRGETAILKKSTVIYYGDVYDHILRIMDNVDILNNAHIGMSEIFLTGSSNKLNETMKVLTVISAIFIPLTFIVGIYGMNFKYMPELDYKWSYPLLWFIITLTGVLMILYFRRRKWI